MYIDQRSRFKQYEKDNKGKLPGKYDSTIYMLFSVGKSFNPSILTEGQQLEFVAECILDDFESLVTRKV